MLMKYGKRNVYLVLKTRLEEFFFLMKKALSTISLSYARERIDQIGWFLCDVEFVSC